MKLGIISAISAEVALLLNELEECTEVNSPFKIYTGVLRGIDVVICICGLGKANAAAATQSLIDKFVVTEIINLGICGGLVAKYRIADVLVSTTFVQHDFNLALDGKHNAWHPTYKSHSVTTKLPTVIDSEPLVVMASGDRFVKCKSLKKQLVESTRASGCDMESSAIAQICYLHDLPFISIRGVSDIAETVPDEFEDNMKKAIRASTMRFLSDLNPG
jgi:adenosylhomocysteine nucleosidase